MHAKVSKMGGLLKSSFFNSLIFCNFIISICFVTLIVFEGMNNISVPKHEAIEQNPLPESISEQTAQLIQNP
jgi:hypothetical protein